MKKRFTLTPRKRKLKTNRQATVGVLEAMVLIGVAIAGVSVLGFGLSEYSFETLSCEVQFFKVYQVDDDNYWAELVLYNNGDFIFDASLKYFDSITISNLKSDSLNNIRPGDTANLEFQFTGILGNSVAMGFDIINNDQKTMCAKEVLV